MSDPNLNPTEPSKAQLLRALLSAANDTAKVLKQSVVTLPNGYVLPPTEAEVIKLLGSMGPMTIPQLARIRGTSRQNIQVVADRLAADGVLSFEPNPAHRRSMLARLTPQGRGLPEAAQATESNLLSGLESQFSPKELTVATEILLRVKSLCSHHFSPNRKMPERASARTAQSDSKTRPNPYGEPASEELPVSLL